MGTLSKKLWKRAGIALVGVIGMVAYAPRAEGVVVTGLSPMARPADGWVGSWNGSSCVAVGRYWFVTAKHVGGSVGQNVTMRGVEYRAVEIRPHPSYDVQLIRVAEVVPGYHKLAVNVGLGDPVVVGGYGVTAAAALPSSGGGVGGYDWNGPRQETWGANVIEGDGNLLAIRFDPPSAPSAVPEESIFAVNDSGGGLFAYGSDGSLELAGIAVSVSNFGSSPWSANGFALNIDMYRVWIQPIVDPTAPISSGSGAPPRAMMGVPGLPMWAGGVIVCGVLAGLRRRR